MATPPTTIAYLAPELPALSATFVYEELLAVERRGIRVVPFSVHRPAKPVAAQAELAARTKVVYGTSAATVALRGLTSLPRFGLGAIRALGWLLADVAQLGPWRPSTWKLAYQFLAGACLARDMRSAGCSHVHVHFAHVPTQIAMYASAMSGIPFTVMAHANDIFERGALLPQKASRAAKFLTISDHNVRYLHSVGVAPSRMEVVRCGVSFTPRAEIPRFDTKPCYRIGTLGRLVEKKGVDDLLRAVASLREAPWQLELSIAGDGPLQADLTALAKELGIADRVRFEGALQHSAVTGWLQSLDVFALACKADANGDMDGIPVVLMEAMSQRVPVLSTRLSGIPELVMHERTGLLAEPAHPASLAQALRALLDDPTLRARLTDAAVRHVEDEFGQGVNIDRLLRHVELPPSAERPAVSTVSASRS